MSMPRLVVVGGGIAGLAAAWTARRAGADLDVVVLEREREVGGKARSNLRDGWIAEGGPSGFLGGRPELDRLIDEAGLRGETVSAQAASKRRFVHLDGRMREIVPHPLRLISEGLLSVGGAVRMLGEPFVRRFRGEEETVWEFAARRLGAEFADRLILPMTLGVFAGDGRALSLDAAFPRMRALEREHGGLIRGLIAKRGTMGGTLTSFRDGIQALPLALARRGGFEVRRGALATAIERDADRWLVHVGAGTPLLADALVLAGEPWAMAGLVAPHEPAIAADLRAIRCPPVSVVALGYEPPAASRFPVGFGALIARGEGYRMLGTLWETHIYPRRSPDGCVLVRAIFGGAVDEGIGALDEGTVLALAREEVARMHGIDGAPAFTHVERWPRAIPQYELGHPARVRRIDDALTAMPGLWITGNGLRGVSFADAAVDGIRTGERAVVKLRRQ